MKIPFTKLHGAKNDFLMTMVEGVPTLDLQEVAIAICERYTGVGGDGWMLLDRTGGDDPSGEAFDAAIRLFNSDGSEPEISGNGTRCAAALLADSQPEKRDFRIWTGAGVKHVRLISRNARKFEFEMNMGNIRVVELSAQVRGRDAVIIDAGNPQCVFPVDDFDFDWRSVGAAVETDLRFPEPHERFVCPASRLSYHRRSFLGAGRGRDEQFGYGFHGSRRRGRRKRIRGVIR